MIKINLALRKQSAGVAEAKAKGALGKFDFNVDQLKELPIRKVALVAVVVLLGNYVLDSYKEDELAKMDAVIRKAQADQDKLKAELGKTKEFDQVKKALEADEFTLKTKIDTIQALLMDRGSGGSRLLMSLSSSIPREVWLSSFKIENAEVQMKGAALGFNQISDFMKSLNESALFTDLKLQSTQQVRDEVSGTDVATFEMEARKR